MLVTREIRTQTRRNFGLAALPMAMRQLCHLFSAAEEGQRTNLGMAARIAACADVRCEAEVRSSLDQPCYTSVAFGGATPKNAASTVDGQRHSSRPPSGPVLKPWIAPGGMNTKVPGPTPSAGSVSV